MNRIKTVVFMFAACYLPGCVSTWHLSDGEMLQQNGISVGTPDKWFIKKTRQSTVLTRHGPALEYISLDNRKWKDTLSNGYVMPKTILLHQIPEIILGEWCANGYAYDLQVLSDSIAPVDGFYCAQTRYRYAATNTLKMKGLMYCIPFKQYLTILIYEAEESCYFERSFKDFLKMTSDITINKKNYRKLPGIRATSKYTANRCKQ